MFPSLCSTHSSRRFMFENIRVWLALIKHSWPLILGPGWTHLGQISTVIPWKIVQIFNAILLQLGCEICCTTRILLPRQTFHVLWSLGGGGVFVERARYAARHPIIRQCMNMITSYKAQKQAENNQHRAVHGWLVRDEMWGSRVCGFSRLTPHLTPQAAHCCGRLLVYHVARFHGDICLLPHWWTSQDVFCFILFIWVLTSCLAWNAGYILSCLVNVVWRCLF